MQLYFLYNLFKTIWDTVSFLPQLAFVNMSSRCGSTLLSQAMDRLPYCRSFAEPNAFNDVNRLYQMGHISAEENKKLIQRYVGAVYYA